MEVVLAAILMKNRKNGPKLNFGLQYLENSPTYDTDMYVVFNIVDNDPVSYTHLTLPTNREV